MDDDTAQLFSKFPMISKAVKDYLQERGFTTIASLRAIPTDSELLVKYLAGCPDIGTNLSVRRGLRCLLSELPSGSDENTPSGRAALAAEPTNKPAQATLQEADTDKAPQPNRPIPAPRNVRPQEPTKQDIVQPAPKEERPAQTLSTELKSDIDNFIRSAESDFLKQLIAEGDAMLAEVIGVKQFHSLTEHAHQIIVAELQQEAAKISQGKSTESTLKQLLRTRRQQLKNLKMIISNHVTNAINCLKQSVLEPLQTFGIPNQVDVDQKVVLAIVIPTFEQESSYDYLLDKEGRLEKAFAWLKNVQSGKEVDSFTHFYLANHLTDHSRHFCYRFVSSSVIPVSHTFACLFEDRGKSYLLPHRSSGAQINVYPSKILGATNIRLDVRLHWTWKRAECRALESAPCKILFQAAHAASGTSAGKAASVLVPNEAIINGLSENSDYSISYEVTYFDNFTNGVQKLAHVQRTAESKAKIMRHQSQCCDKAKYYYELPKTEVSNNDEIRKVRVGASKMGQLGHKVILIVGGTGSGKSTFINSLANYLYEVEFEHPFRFQLITDRDNANEAMTADTSRSQTRKVTAYELNETRLPYRLTLVDTPGFGDTEGLTRDKLTFEYIKKWFEQRDENGLHTIDAVCTVVKGTEARFNAQVQYELRSVQSLFGLDMKGNMMHVFTFCDNKDPPAVKVLRDEGLLVGDKIFQLNNRGIMEINEADEDLLRLFWNKCHTSIEQFFKTLQDIKPQSVVLTLDVLYHRKALEKQTAILGDQMSTHVTKLQQITSIIKQVQKKSQKTQVKIKRKRWVPTQMSYSATTANTWCKNCNFTCHENCTEVSEHETSLINCDVMTVKHPILAQCTACPKNCSWKAHLTVDFIVTYDEIEEEITIEELYAEYGIRSEDNGKLTKLMRHLAIEVIEQDKTVGNILKSIRQRLNELNLIAMRPKQATDSQYLKFLIELEKQKLKMRPGDDDDQRLQVLENHLKIVRLVESSGEDKCYIDETESAAIAYLCNMFPDLYKELRRNGQFGLADEDGVSAAAVLERIEQTNPVEYVAVQKRTAASGPGQKQAKLMLDAFEVSHPTIVEDTKKALTRKQVSAQANQQISDATLDAEVQAMRTAIDAAVQTSDQKPKQENLSRWQRFKRFFF